MEIETKIKKSDLKKAWKFSPNQRFRDFLYEIVGSDLLEKKGSYPVMITNDSLVKLGLPINISDQLILEDFFLILVNPKTAVKLCDRCFELQYRFRYYDCVLYETLSKIKKITPSDTHGYFTMKYTSNIDYFVRKNRRLGVSPAESYILYNAITYHKTKNKMIAFDFKIKILSKVNSFKIELPVGCFYISKKADNTQFSLQVEDVNKSKKNEILNQEVDLEKTKLIKILQKNSMQFCDKNNDVLLAVMLTDGIPLVNNHVSFQMAENKVVKLSFENKKFIKTPFSDRLLDVIHHLNSISKDIK